MVKHNTELDKLGKQYLPEGFDLDVDRSKTASTVHKLKDFDKWKRNTSRSDLKGFDTRSARERPIKSVVKNIKGIHGYTTSGEDAIINETDRFLKPGQETRRLLDKVKNEFYDFESFKSAIKKSWSTDNSLRALVDEVRRDDIWEMLYNTDLVQGYLKNNTDVVLTEAIKRKYNVEEGRARKILSKLDDKSRSRLIRNSDIKVSVKSKPKQMTPIKVDSTRMLRQKSRSGKYYVRKKPVRWTKLEERLLINNKGKSFNQISDIYRRVFSGKGRTDSSIKNKIYRLKSYRL